MDAHWFEDHLPYTISKYNMSMITFGLARSLAVFGVAVNSLWPETAIDTAAIRMLEKLSKKPMVKHSRKPAIVADAARWILSQPSRQCTGNFFTDAQVLTASGITDLSGYATSPGEPLLLDYFRPWPSPEFKS
jgi:citronellol/citronellal dehydrogenase